MTILRVLMLSCLALAAVACGGGGGGGGAAIVVLSPFNGTYSVFLMQGQSGATDTVVCGFGTVTADGLGQFNGGIIVNNTGVLSGPVAIGSDYEVDAGGQMRLLDAGGVTYRGGLSPDGSVAVLGSVSGAPAFMIVIRFEAGVVEASLDGGWHFGRFGSRAGVDTFASVGNILFNGAGGWNGLADTENVEGVVLPNVVLDDPDRTYSIDQFSELLVSQDIGRVAAGSEFMLTVSNRADSTHETVFMAPSVDATVARLDGEYWIAGIKNTSASGRWESWTGSGVAFGNGTFLYAVEINEEGIVSASPFLGLPHGIQANGVMTAVVGADVYEGVVSPSGKYAFLGGGIDGLDDTLLVFLVRR